MDKLTTINEQLMQSLKPYAIIMHPADTITVQEKSSMLEEHPFYSKLELRIMKGLVLSDAHIRIRPKIVAYFLDGTRQANIERIGLQVIADLRLHPTLDDVCIAGQGCASPFTIDYSKFFSVFFSGSIEKNALYDMPISKNMSIVCEGGKVVDALRRNHNNVYWCL